jgi:uncharacterized protein
MSLLRTRANAPRRPWALLFLLLPPLLLVGPVREAYQVDISHPIVTIPGLPHAFGGLKVAVLADVHRGPFMSERRVGAIVAQTNAQHPDVIVLVGDYVHRGGNRYIPSVWGAFAALKAPLGVYAILGNHDYWEGGPQSLAAMARANITDVTNRNVSVERGGEKLFLAGVDDLWAGKPDLQAAMKGLGHSDTALLLCHNPDYIERVSDPRAKLWLSGHTHGGQVCLRPNRPLVHPSKCGLRYIGGLRRCQQTQIYVSRGLGTVTPPIRMNCPPELPIIELQPG